MEFMFWGWLLYDKKGPCHIWERETVKEKREAELVIAAMNVEIEPTAKLKWELETGLRRLALRNLPRVPPTWKFGIKTGAMGRKAGKGRINWWRYQLHIIIPKLIPFAKECKKERLRTIV